MNELDEVINKIEVLSKELQDLQIAHSAVGLRITEVSQELKNVTKSFRKYKVKEHTKGKPTERKVSLEECRGLVGSRVRIVNSKHIDECFGNIIKVGTLYIMMQLPNGGQKRRIASNI